MSEWDSDKKPEANQEHTHTQTRTHTLAHTHVFSPCSRQHLYFLISDVTHMLYGFLYPSPVSLQVFLSRRSEWLSLSLSKEVCKTEWVSWKDKEEQTILPTKTCFSWEPLQQLPPLWSPSWLCWSVLAAKGKTGGHMMWNGGQVGWGIKYRTATVFSFSFCFSSLRSHSHHHHPLFLFMCLCFFWTLLLPPFFSLHPSTPSHLSPALSRVAVMNVNGWECRIRWNDVYRTLTRQARARAASRHPSPANCSAGKSNGTPRGSQRIRLWARQEQWNSLWLFFCRALRDQSEALWLCCHGIKR